MANFCLFMPFSQKILETTGVLLYDINTSTLWTVCFPQSRMIQGVSRKGRDTMSSIDSVSATQSSAVYSSQNTSVKNNTAAVESASAANASAGSKADSSNGVTLEVSSEAKAAAAAKDTSSVKKYANPDVVAKLQADAEQRTSQLKSIVEQLIGKQAKAFGDANDIWSVLREGKFTVDPATKAQAEKDISEDGYWGVKQTSERILDFAKALVGDDPDQLEKMRDAFEKGYKAAEKTWGGELPEISKQTYDAVLKGFDELTKKDVSAVSEN